MQLFGKFLSHVESTTKSKHFFQDKKANPNAIEIQSRDICAYVTFSIQMELRSAL